MRVFRVCKKRYRQTILPLSITIDDVNFLTLFKLAVRISKLPFLTVRIMVYVDVEVNTCI